MTSSSGTLSVLVCSSRSANSFRSSGLPGFFGATASAVPIERVHAAAQQSAQPMLRSGLNDWLLVRIGQPTIGASAAPMRFIWASVIRPSRIFWKRSSPTPDAMY